MGAQADLDAGRLAGDDELLVGGQAVADLAAAAAELLGVAQAEQADLGGARVQLARELLGFVPGVRERRDLLLGEATDLGTQGGVLLGLEQVGHAARYRGGRARAILGP